MFYNPAVYTGNNPEAIDTECYNTQQKPFNPLSEQANARAGELQLEAFDVGMLGNPTLLEY